MKKNLLFSLWLTILTLFSTHLYGQDTEVIFSENMGTTTTTKTISNNVFQNTNLTFSGSADVRATSPSNPSDYSEASAGANVMINAKDEYFIISGINTSSYTDIRLSFGQRKGVNNANNELKVFVKDLDTNIETQLTYTRNTGNNTSTWIMVNPTGEIPTTSNLEIRFLGTNSTEWRIDDVKLVGELIPLTEPELVSPQLVTGTYGVLLPNYTVQNNGGRVTEWNKDFEINLPEGIVFTKGEFSGTPLFTSTSVNPFTMQVKGENNLGVSFATINFVINKANQKFDYDFQNIAKTLADEELSLPKFTKHESVDINANQIFYQSSNPDVVQVRVENDEVKLSFVGTGQAVITYGVNPSDANYNNNYTNINNGQFTIDVTKANQTLLFDDIISAYTPELITIPLATNEGVTLTSLIDNEDIAVIDENGKLKLLKAGVATLTLSNEGNGIYNPFTATIAINITKAVHAISPALGNREGVKYNHIVMPATTNAGVTINYTTEATSGIEIVNNKINLNTVGTYAVTATVAEDDRYLAYSTNFNVVVKDYVTGVYVGEGTFNLINNSSQLEDGYYVITNETKAFLMTNTHTTVFASSASNVTTEETIINPLANHVWYIKNEGNNNQYSIANGGKYVGHNGVEGRDGNLATYVTALADNTKWTFTYSENKWTVNNVAYDVRQLSYNNGSPRFAAYANANQEELQLFKLTTPLEEPTVWDGQTWSLGTPTAQKEAIIIANIPSSQGQIHAKKVKVFRDVIIPSGNVVEVEDNIEIADNATLTFEPEAYFLQNNETAVNTGNVVYKVRSQNMMRNDMSHWSSPVTGQYIRAFSPGTLYNRFWTYNENTSLYKTIFASNTAADQLFEVGKGIAMRVKFDIPADYNEPTIGEFKGQLFNGDLTVAVTKNKDGYNLVGNPYPSPIGVTEFFNANPNVDKLFIWTPFYKINHPEFGNNYITITRAGATSPRGGAVTMNQIAAGQGFFVQVTSAGTIAFNNAMRQGTATTFQRNEEENRFWLGLSKNDVQTNEILVGYSEGTTEGVDFQYEAGAVETGASRLYTIIDNAAYSIQARPYPLNVNDRVRLGLVTNEAGQLTIALNNAQGIFNTSQEIFIEDKKLEIIHSLSTSPYVFTTEELNVNDRFEIIYLDKTLNVSEVAANKQVQVYRDGELTVIKSTDANIQYILVYDNNGRLVKKVDNIRGKTTQLNLNKGVYYLNVILDDNTKEFKKVLTK